MTENGWLMLDFPGRIWEIWTGSDTIRISQIRDGKWLADAAFSGTNLGNLDGSDTIRISQIRDVKWLAEHGGQV